MCAINGPHSAWESCNSVEICHCLHPQVLLGGSDDLVGHASEDCGDNLAHTSANGGLCHPSHHSTCTLKRATGKEMECCQYLDSGSTACGQCVWLVVSSFRVVVNSMMAVGLNLKVRYTSESHMPKTSMRVRYPLPCPPPPPPFPPPSACI